MEPGSIDKSMSVTVYPTQPVWDARMLNKEIEYAAVC